MNLPRSTPSTVIKRQINVLYEVGGIHLARTINACSSVISLDQTIQTYD